MMTKAEIEFYTFWVEDEKEREEIAEWIKQKSEDAEAEYRTFHSFED